MWTLVPLLTAVQARYPQDFWLNFALGASLHEADWWDEALGYYRAALAIRPDVSAAHNGVGVALYAKGRHEEAIGYFEQALLIDPESVAAHGNLGNCPARERPDWTRLWATSSKPSASTPRRPGSTLTSALL